MDQTHHPPRWVSPLPESGPPLRIMIKLRVARAKSQRGAKTGKTKVVIVIVMEAEGRGSSGVARVRGKGAGSATHHGYCTRGCFPGGPSVGFPVVLAWVRPVFSRPLPALRDHVSCTHVAYPSKPRLSRYSHTYFTHVDQRAILEADKGPPSDMHRVWVARDRGVS